MFFFPFLFTVKLVSHTLVSKRKRESKCPWKFATFFPGFCMFHENMKGLWVVCHHIWFYFFWLIWCSRNFEKKAICDNMKIICPILKLHVNIHVLHPEGWREANAKGNIKGAVQNKLTSTNYSKNILTL